VVSCEAEKEAFDKRNLLGKSVLTAFDPQRIHLFDPTTEKAVYHSGLI
jgi:hypothetical protein